MAKMNQAAYGVDVRDACIRRGVDNAYQLWLKIGGSKATAALLWDGTAKQIQMETMNKLRDLLGITPPEYLVDKRNR